MTQPSIEELQKKLQQAKIEVINLTNENKHLRNRLAKCKGDPEGAIDAEIV